MNPIRRQRLLLVLLLLAGIGVAVTLMLFALSENINHYYSPTEMANGTAPIGKKIRGGGIVVEDSVNRDTSDLTVVFAISDGARSVEVEYTGILPDLFREGQGIVGTGALNGNGRFVAEELLAKHDENYTPNEVQRALDDAATHSNQKGGHKENAGYESKPESLPEKALPVKAVPKKEVKP